MRAYQTYRFEQSPDISDIQSDGRASHIGKLPEKNGEYKPYMRSSYNRRATRRTLKRQDRQRMSRIDRLFGDD